MSKESLIYSNISEDETVRLMHILGESVEGEDIGKVIAGCVAVALTASNPAITIDKVMEKLQPVSEVIAMYATDTANDSTIIH